MGIIENDYSLEEKVKFIKGIFKFYQPTLNVVEQIALLTVWEQKCVDEEEYEMAQIIKVMMNNIQKHPNKVPQKLIDEFSCTEMVKPPSLYIKIIKWFKNIFKKNYEF